MSAEVLMTMTTPAPFTFVEQVYVPVYVREGNRCLLVAATNLLDDAA